LRRVESSFKTASFAFYQKKASPIKQAHLGDKFKKASRSICTSTVVLSGPFVSYSINIEEDPDDSEPADEGDIRMEYSFD
jgi:hypothetical protein